MRPLFVLACVVLATTGALAQPAAIDASARARILALGPWPPPWSPDPSNRVSGVPAAIAFGERLFFDTRLSGNGLVSCAGCHRPKQHWTDGHEKAIGHTGADRNTPTVANVRHARWFGWDGAHDNLWSQSLRPITDSREMNFSVAQIAKVVRDEPAFACRYKAAFGKAVPADDEEVAVDAAKAMAAFQESIVSGRTPFDEFRDALARNDARAMSRYPADALRGLLVFVGRGRCDACHAGPLLTSGGFHDVGTTPGPGAIAHDAGREAGLRKLKASPYNLLGRWNDDASRRTAARTKDAIAGEYDVGGFRVPSLRNVALTAPYMHDGSVKALRDAARHFAGPAHPGLANGPPPPLDGLTERETDDLVAFLRTLDEPAAPFRRREVVEPKCD
jgi:cytochrome c peroxidase